MSKKILILRRKGAIFFLGYASLVRRKYLTTWGILFFSPIVQIYFYYIEKAGFIVLFTQEKNRTRAAISA
ncbi:MAG: hypothetical protein A2096_07355 [Spirochaetes bacterium GWF1_41_5]|nr:MAG: hypothetical protein A2096_07355 [Spirochaetes bacterium GWF1_41_5]